MKCENFGCYQEAVREVGGIWFCERHASYADPLPRELVPYDENEGGPFVMVEGKLYKAFLVQMLRQYDEGNMAESLSAQSDIASLYAVHLIKFLRKEVANQSGFLALHGMT